jgi:hypothetical protein
MNLSIGIFHHRNNRKRSILAESRVHQVPLERLDSTLMLATDDFLLFALVAELGIGVWLTPVTPIKQ